MMGGMESSEITLPAGLAEARMLIGGEWVDAAEEGRIEVENPSRRTVLATVPRGGAADCDRAVAAAAAAFPAWRALPARERGRLLIRIADGLEARGEELARTIAAETGNAIRTQARPEATTAADVFRYFGGVAGEQKGEVLPLGDQLLSYSVREPLGVVAGIIPWNAPMMLGSLKVAMALCTGNTLVLKAAEDAPLAVLAMAQVCDEVLPAGVLNVITGTGEECGAPLLEHPGIAKISFTGSTEVGRIAMRAAAARILPVSLELGGKSPSIVFPDAGDDATVSGVIAAMRFARQGQSCTAGSRLYVHESIFDGFLERLTAALEKLVVGDALDERSDIGSIVSGVQDTRVCGYVEEALANGATALTGGLPPAAAPRLPARPDRADRDRALVARHPRGGVRARARGAPLERRGRGAALGERHALRPRRLRVVARPRRRAPRRPSPRGGLGAGQPRRRPAAGDELRRQEAERHRLGVLDRGRAGELHSAQEHHDRDRFVAGGRPRPRTRRDP